MEIYPINSSSRVDSDGRSFGLVSDFRSISAPGAGLWSTWAGAREAGRLAFGWVTGDAALLALDRSPDGPLQWHARRFDEPRAGSIWGAWPAALTIRPAGIARWTGARVEAYGNARFAGWPSGALASGRPARDGAPMEDLACWSARVTAAEAACRTGALRKVVLARAIRHPGRHCPVATARALHAANPDATVFFVSQGDQCFLGATPETLLRITGRRLATHALAGTRPRGATPAEDAALAADLLESIKDRREHALVVADLAATLAPLCVALDWAPTPTIRRLATVQHLETPFWGVLRAGIDPARLAAALHPTAALGGLPRAAAGAWLRAHEGLDRGFYGAPIGWSQGDDAHFAVAIRSALITPDAAYTFGGAGIVAASDPQAEWAETALKQAVVARALRRRG